MTTKLLEVHTHRLLLTLEEISKTCNSIKKQRFPGSIIGSGMRRILAPATQILKEPLAIL